MQTLTKAGEPNKPNGNIPKRGVVNPKPFRLNVKQYYQMDDLGFFRGRRVELIEGEIVQMSPMKSPHMVAIQLINEALRTVFGRGFVVLSQMPIRLSKTNEPEPDVTVVKGKIRDFVESLPNHAELVIEVSESTLRFDRGEKAGLYARYGIQDYWILNLKGRCLEVHRHPVKSSDGKAYYSEILTVNAGDSITPLIKPKSKIKVSDILP
ncbi:MAG: Uma2 family endonuclease [Pyrinomonadaceae bacterium]